MAITIDGTGNITGLLAGGLPDLSVTNADLATNAVSTSKVLDGAITTAKMGSSEQSGLAKAWVNFNGTGTVAIRASYNVSSITDNGTGDYTVNFTTAMADANYACSALSHFAEDAINPAGMAISIARQTGAYTASSVRVSASATSSLTAYDQTRVCVAIFR
jgi:hypothetical protein